MRTYTGLSRGWTRPSRSSRHSGAISVAIYPTREHLGFHCVAEPARPRRSETIVQRHVPPGHRRDERLPTAGPLMLSRGEEDSHPPELLEVNPQPSTLRSPVPLDLWSNSSVYIFVIFKSHKNASVSRLSGVESSGHQRLQRMFRIFRCMEQGHVTDQLVELSSRFRGLF